MSLFDQLFPQVAVRSAPKVTFSPSNPDVVAVGMARAPLYACLPAWRPTWTKLGTIDSNGKPIATIFRWTGEGAPIHPGSTDPTER